VAEVISADDKDSAAGQAVELLRAGRLAVVPTDTVYTVIADAFSTFATQRMFGAKRRGRSVPLSVLIRNPRQVIGLARDIPETAERIMASYWPGPVSILLPVQPDMPWDLGDSGDAINLRMPADDLLLAIAAEIGPLAATAANRRGEPAATTVDEARTQLGDTIDLYVDGGPSTGVVTTVVDCTRADAHVLREGSIAADDILAVAAGDVNWGDRPAPEHDSSQPHTTTTAEPVAHPAPHDHQPHTPATAEPVAPPEPEDNQSHTPNPAPQPGTDSP
jgi:L-threonylcarbamoyladenylate synthase